MQLLSVAAIGVIVLPTTAHAQRGRSRGAVVRPVVIAPYYSPYYNPFFWDSFGWGMPGQYPPWYYGSGLTVESAARVQVTPRHTEVYVDGYRAGIVDDFDGFSQRLRVAPGEHVIELYLDGHRPISQTIMFAPGETYRLRHAMEPLPAGEAAPARPTPRAVPAAPALPPIYDTFGRPVAMPAPPPGMAAQGGGGALAIRVQPVDALVLIDGEPWQASGGGDRLEVQVSPGPHRIEVRKDGYLPFTTTVQVRPGDTTPINVSLTKGEQ